MAFSIKVLFLAVSVTPEDFSGESYHHAIQSLQEGGSKGMNATYHLFMA